LTLNFPTDLYETVDTPAILAQALGSTPIVTYKGKTDFMAVFATEQEIQDLKPNFELLNALACRGVIVTAPGTTSDFVSRFFGPQSGINEDPVTGSAHTTLTPYWAAQLGKTELTAIQVSARRGYLKCVHMGDRVGISGNAVTYMIGEINVEML
jgi:PhzF family phenazine biosynthesis protein